ncbi:MAG: hypothetical protein V4850_03315 [Myxococcota bacterium]
MSRRFVLLTPLVFAPLLLATGCGHHGVNSPAEAELAYMGLDGAVQRGLALGLQGFALASSANIDPQSQDGDTNGGMIISGQVDQGSSDNKGLRLFMELDEYSDTLGSNDEPDLFYQTDGSDLPALNITLKDMPAGTLDGTLAGDFEMAGTLGGYVELDVVFAGETEDDGSGIAVRKAGTTRITGSASSDYGVFEIDLVR